MDDVEEVDGGGAALNGGDLRCCTKEANELR